ncbi:MAG: hypothetical protein JWQ44_1281 [Chthoniobacter sp.]|nr:hypothetical protein [Chthoniobacter sp.]
MEYTVIFDVSESGYRHWWFPSVGLIFVVIGSVLFRFRHQLGHRTPEFLPYLFLGFSILWTVFALVVTAAGHSHLSAALREGRCEVVEGIVTEFQPMPTIGKGSESFIVSGKRFEYSDFVVSPGFKHSTYKGGPMREGLAVRIHYVGDDIARLEVAR